uniref:ARAD1A02706p n=1 Tax=Blastobotrys adeninivorans TaxID=409370 RepID=A0A060SXA4_BLAAD
MLSVSTMPTGPAGPTGPSGIDASVVAEQLNDLSYKLDRLKVAIAQAEQDKVILEKRIKLGRNRPLDYIPEDSRLIGHTPDTLNCKIDSLKYEVKRVRLLKKQLKRQLATN